MPAWRTTTGFEVRTNDELANRAAGLSVERFSSLNEDDLVKAVRDKQ